MSEAEQRLRDLTRQLLDCPDDDRAIELVTDLRRALHDYVQETRRKLGLPRESVGRAA